MDLHTHTTASDGTLAPTALVDLADEKCLDTIAITDHDTVAGISAAIEHGKGRGVLVIPGVELGAHWCGPGQMHILGYYIDYHHPVLLSQLAWLKDRRRERAQRIIDHVNAAGARVSWSCVVELAGSASVGRPHVARALVDAGCVDSISEAFSRYLNPGKPGYIENVQLTPREAIDLICTSGGSAVLAHPATLQVKEEELEMCIRGLIKQGLRGIEVYSSKHDSLQISRYQEIAKRHRLLMTGGSDFHGANKPGIELGAGLEGRFDEPALLRNLKSRGARHATGKLVPSA